MYGIWSETASKVIAQFVVPVSIKSNVPIFMSDTMSLSRKISKRSAQRWEVSANLGPMADGAQTLMTSLVTQGSSEPMSIIIPQNVGAVRNTTCTTTVNTVAIDTGLPAGIKDSSTVFISGASGTKLSEGLLITFNTGKVYMLTQDVTLSSKVSANIFPPLRQNISAGVTVNHTDVKMTCYYDTDTVFGMSYSDGILMDPGNLKFIEKI